MEKTKIEFSAQYNGEVKEFYVRRPTKKDFDESNSTYFFSFNQALKNGAPLRRRVGEILREQGLWNDEKQEQSDNLQAEITNQEFILKQGGISLSQARDIALSLHYNRIKLNKAMSVHTELDTKTVEGQADNDKFSHLVSLCTFTKNTERKVYKTYEEYVDQANSEVAMIASAKLANMLYNLDDTFYDNLPENQFLTEYKFIDKDGRLIDKDGNFIDRKGRRVNQEGYLVDENGNRVDTNGHQLDEEGNWKIEPKPFLDDEGNPVDVVQSDS